MRTIHTTVKNNDFLHYDIEEKREQIQSLNATIDYCISVSGDYCSALEFMRTHGITSRLSDDKVARDGMALLAQLRDLRVSLEGELDDMIARDTRD